MGDALPLGIPCRAITCGFKTVVRVTCVGIMATAMVVATDLPTWGQSFPLPGAVPVRPLVVAVVAAPDDVQVAPAAAAQAVDVAPAKEEPAKEEPAKEEPAKEEAADEVQAVAVEQAQPAPNVVNWNYFSDGIMRYGVNGQIREQRADAVEQAATSYPNIKIARVMPGDTLVKLAEQCGVPADRLALLNRTTADRTFDAVGVVVVEWKYRWPTGQTLEGLAAMLEVPVETLKQLNELKDDQPPEVGRELLIPGQLMYHAQGREGYLQVAMYGVQVQQNIPYKPETIRMQQHPLAKDQTLADFAEKHSVKEDFLREMNGLKADEEVPAHTMLLVEYSCELTDKATVDAIVNTFQIDRARFLTVNGWKEDKDFDVTKRVHLPIGERIRHQVVQAAQQAEPLVPVEIELGEAPAPAPAPTPAQQ